MYDTKTCRGMITLTLAMKTQLPLHLSHELRGMSELPQEPGTREGNDEVPENAGEGRYPSDASRNGPKPFRIQHPKYVSVPL